MKTIIRYSLIWVVLFLVTITFGMFISGVSNIMDWDKAGRFTALFLPSMATTFIIINKK